MKSFIKTSLLLFALFHPLFLQGTEFEVKVIKGEEDLPEKFCTQWKAGDILISDGKILALIGGTERRLKTILNYPGASAMGSIISFVPAGNNLQSNLNIGSPIITIGDKREDLIYSSVKPIEETSPEKPLAFEATARFDGKKGEKAQVRTLYLFFPDEWRVDITSILTNTGKKDFKDLNYSLSLDAMHRYSFSPFHSEKHPELRFRVYQRKGYYLARIDLNPYLDEEFIPGKLAPGETYQTRYVLLVDTRHDNLLRRIYRIFNQETEEATIHLQRFSGDDMEIIIQDALTSSIFFRSFLKDLTFITLPLPPGTYKATTHFFPAIQEELFVVKAGEENAVRLECPPLGRVKIKILDSSGEPVPGKVTFIGLYPTQSPYFMPENPVESGKNWETFKNSCFPEEDGLDITVPAGTYLVYASRGPEYSMDKKVVEILSDEVLELIFRIDRVVKTPNLISVDPHLHTQDSDGRMQIRERIKSVVAEGVEVAIATDHNFINDYSPDLKRLGLNKHLAVISGTEVTTAGVIHYNTYPLQLRPDEENNGAIYPRSEEVTPLFEASRKKDPQAILQVNHPRDGDIGYFNNYHLDRESAAYAREHFDLSFDVLEVINGPYYHSNNADSIEDWFHLLNRGYYFPLVGSSDAHGIDRGEPGYCRTYIYYSGEGGDDLDWGALAQAIKKGNSFSSNGPIIEFKVNSKYRPGETLTAANGKIEVTIEVQSAPWIAVDEVRLIVNGERKVIFPVKKEKEKIQKFIEPPFGLTLKQDSYIAVEVSGRESLFPVLQRASRNGLSTSAILPYALTNPVFIDIDGNGRFDSPLPEKIKLLGDMTERKN